MTRNWVLGIVGSLMLVVQPVTARADLISLDINGYGGAPDNPLNLDTYSGAAAIGTAGDFWNAPVIQTSVSNSFSVSNLRLVDGVTTTTVSFALATGPGDVLLADTVEGQRDAATWRDLLNDYVATGNTNYTITISGLNSNGTYHLYLYGQNGGYNNRFGDFTFDGIRKTGATTVFSNLVADANGEITGILHSGTHVLNGFQLQGDFLVIPEPSALLLVGLGLVGTWFLRRHRRG